MQLTFDADVEAFRDEFIAFLDEHLPDEADTTRAFAVDGGRSAVGPALAAGDVRPRLVAAR